MSLKKRPRVEETTLETSEVDEDEEEEEVDEDIEVEEEASSSDDDVETKRLKTLMLKGVVFSLVLSVVFFTRCECSFLHSL